MAIIENNTQNYFRILYNECFIQNNMVFISVIKYIHYMEREKEKNRQMQFDKFIVNCKNELQILKQNNDELYIDFSIAINNIIQESKTSEIKLHYSKEIEKILLKCGYNYDWASQPIVIVGKCLVNGGEVNINEFSHRDLYLILKNKMTVDIYDA